jgi:HD-GYP domain-containing protein (c-di-GMP phosphodiesterase class II)
MKDDKNTSSQEKHTLLSENLFAVFNKLVQSVRIHQDNNQLVIQSAEGFINAVNCFSEDESHLKIQIISNRFYLQGEKLLYPREMSNLINNALDYFEKRDLFGLSISATIHHKDLRQVILFAHLLNHAENHKDPTVWLEKQISRRDLNWVKIIPKPNETDKPQESETSDSVKKAKMSYASSLEALKEVINKVSNDQSAGIRKTVRTVQKMVDLVIEKQPILLKLSTLRSHDDYTYTHSVNVAILAMCLGLHIGLSKNTLETLGICGLFHDLGKADIPLKILNKEGELTEPEFEAIKKHSLKSAYHIAKLRASRELRSKIMLAPFEHHLKYDLSGYPNSWRNEPVSLFGRILTIVDVFDASTAQRIYRPEALSPDQALRMMVKKSGKDFDPILLKAFINMLGAYPVGTLVKLNTGEIGLIKENLQGRSGVHPLVVLLTPQDNGGYSAGKTIDFSEREGSGDKEMQRIVETYNPALFGIQPAEFIL